MRWAAFFLLFLTLATGCILEDKQVIPEDGGVEAGMCGLCPLEMPICNADLQCVECTATQSGFCAEQTLVCKTDAFECVECNAGSDCNDPVAARCNTAQNECEGCESEADCIGIEGRPLCDDRTCVQCTPGTEEADCSGNSCDPATFMCTGTKVGSLETCQECVADSECGENGSASEAHRCVEMFYPVGERFPDGETGFCLKVFAPGECAQPYAIRISDRESLSGDPLESYCGINETLATCLAVRALEERLNEACSNGDDCPESGLCRDVGGLPDRCTYHCASVVECLENDPEGTPGSTCDSSGAGGAGGAAGDYCGG
jgi:hypothetical protein